MDYQQKGSSDWPFHRFSYVDFLEQSRGLLHKASATGECMAFTCMQLESTPPDTLFHQVSSPANRVKAVARALDTLIEPHGHLSSLEMEALLICFRQPDESAILRMVVRLHRRVTDMAWEDASALGLHIHTGISTFPTDGLDPEVLLSRACAASEAARSGSEGVSSLRFFRPDILVH